MRQIDARRWRRVRAEREAAAREKSRLGEQPTLPLEDVGKEILCGACNGLGVGCENCRGKGIVVASPRCGHCFGKGKIARPDRNGLKDFVLWDCPDCSGRER